MLFNGNGYDVNDDPIPMKRPEEDTNNQTFKEQMLNDYIDYIETKAQEYGEFCILCDRDNLPLIKFIDFLKLPK